MVCPRVTRRALGGLAMACLLLAGTAVHGGARAVKYEPTWASLTAHEVPEWLLDAKFGIYAHWGVYSVPAHGNEWYAKRMYDPRDEAFDWHRKTFGPQHEFGYKELIPRFKAEKFDPEGWAEIVARSGARYAGIAVVHHDGFGLWDSDVYRWNAGKMGPKRDLYGDLVKALREQDLKIIATFHHIRTFDWYLPRRPQDVERGRKEGWDLFDPDYADLYWNRFTGKHEDFIAQWQAKVKEVIAKYRPDVLWFDGGKFQDPASQGLVLGLLSHYYNQGEAWGTAVEVLNKLPTSMQFNFPRGFGVLTFEEGRDRAARVDRAWIDDMKISTRSWGYIEGQTYKPANEILDGLIDRVARGGGLLLSLCPKADGTISEPQRKVLGEMGAWLAANGEAIYGTRPWKIHAEGPEARHHVRRGKHNKWTFGDCDATDVRFTTKGNLLYAIALGWPADNTLTIKTLGTRTKLSSADAIAAVKLVGSDAPVTWERAAGGLTVRLPEGKPKAIACALRIEVKGTLDRAGE